MRIDLIQKEKTRSKNGTTFQTSDLYPIFKKWYLFLERDP